jgi:hypothetical protein
MDLTFNQVAVRNSIIHYGGPFVFFHYYKRLNSAFRSIKADGKHQFTDALLAEGGRVRVTNEALSKFLLCLCIPSQRGNKHIYNI